MSSENVHYYLREGKDSIMESSSKLFNVAIEEQKKFIRKEKIHRSHATTLRNNIEEETAHLTLEQVVYTLNECKLKRIQHECTSKTNALL